MNHDVMYPSSESESSNKFILNRNKQRKNRRKLREEKYINSSHDNDDYDDDNDNLRTNVNEDMYDEALLRTIDTKIVSLAQNGEHESSIGLMEQATAMRVAIFGINSDEVIECTQKLILLYNTVAMTKISNNKYQAALKFLHLAEDLCIDMGESVAHLYTQTLNNIACAYRRMNKLKLALGALKKSLKICNEKNSDGIAVTHLNMCAILSQLKRHNEALGHAQSAVLHCQDVLLSDSIREQLYQTADEGQHSLLTEKIVVLGIAYHNLAVEEEHLKNYDNAVQWYQKAYQLAKEHIGNNETITKTFRTSYNAAKENVKKKSRKKSGYKSRSSTRNT